MQWYEAHLYRSFYCQAKECDLIYISTHFKYWPILSVFWRCFLWQQIGWSIKHITVWSANSRENYDHQLSIKMYLVILANMPAQYLFKQKCTISCYVVTSNHQEHTDVMLVEVNQVTTAIKMCSFQYRLLSYLFTFGIVLLLERLDIHTFLGQCMESINDQVGQGKNIQVCRVKKTGR